MDKLKEILFGFIVIAALGVIFLPMFFNEKHDKKEKVVSADVKPAEHKLAGRKSDKKILEDFKENQEMPAHPIVAKQAVEDEIKTVPEKAPESMPEVEPAPVPAPIHAPKVATQVEVPAPMPEAIKESPAPEIKVEHENIQSTEEKDSKPVEPSKHETKPKIEKKKAAKNKIVTKGLTIQVGTFAVHENAVNLVQKLKRAGYPAYTKNLNRSGRSLTLVLVGPYSSQNAAVESVMSIQNRYGLRGEILHFSPSKAIIEEDDE